LLTDGNLIVENTYEELSDDTKSDYRTIYGFQEYEDIPESFPYEYVDAIETRGDGSDTTTTFLKEKI
jgi:hypothetical protein